MSPAFLALEIGGIIIDDSDQQVKVKSIKGSWHTSKDGHKLAVPMLTVKFALGNFDYSLRHDGGGPYPNGIGISFPSSYNWYQSDAFSLVINGERYVSGAASNEKIQVVENGKRGDAIFQWSNDLAVVRYDFCGYYWDKNLYLLISLDPKVEVKSLSLKLNGFPGGFLRGAQQPLKVLTNLEEFELAAGKVRELNSEHCDRVFLYRSEEQLSSELVGGCGVLFNTPALQKLQVTNQFYSQIILDLPPETRLIKLALCEMTTNHPVPQFKKQALMASERLANIVPNNSQLNANVKTLKEQ